VANVGTTPETSASYSLFPKQTLKHRHRHPTPPGGAGARWRAGGGWRVNKRTHTQGSRRRRVYKRRPKEMSKIGETLRFGGFGMLLRKRWRKSTPRDFVFFK